MRLGGPSAAEINEKACFKHLPPLSKKELSLVQIDDDVGSEDSVVLVDPCYEASSVATSCDEAGATPPVAGSERKDTYEASAEKELSPVLKTEHNRIDDLRYGDYMNINNGSLYTFR